jgi:type IV pilus secretin PilQ/predicted competence protein
MAHINLLPWRERLREERKREFFSILGGIVVIAGGLIFLVHGYIQGGIDNQTARNNFIRDEIQLLDARVVEITDLQQQKQEIQSRMNVITGLQGTRPVIVRIFDGLVKTMQDAVLAGDTARLTALQDGTDPSIIQSLVNQAIASVPIPRGSVGFPGALAVDLGVTGDNASSFAIGYTDGTALIELELSALESTGNGEVIARPKVTTQDKVMATISSGVRIPFQSQAGGTAGGSTTEFEDAVLSLQVTPQITPDGRINMQLDIRQDSVAPGGGDVPAINTNSITTSALVNNGETIVLGGVFREESTITETKTPVLGDVPYLGRLFKRTENQSRRTELLIFITPKIIAEISIR